mmetsp:Transcript_18387/g.57051  ORF Transcript_18387/g.57051 Transcript_18387/m.57051 type:complete len:251 (-) Transcript_18387:149-901(-)
MKRSPPRLYSRPPAPRTASVIRKADSPTDSGWYSAVGWNWMNSMLVTAAPARMHSAMPSPVATAGLVVEGYTCPAPPAATSVVRARKRERTPERVLTASTPKHAGAGLPAAQPSCSALSSRVAKVCSKTSTPAHARTLSSSARSISRPVMSAACRMRLCRWPPSRARWYSPPSSASASISPASASISPLPCRRLKRAPSSISSRTRPGPSLQTTSTARASHKNPPATWVSSMWLSTLSAGSHTALMPPCA